MHRDKLKETAKNINHSDSQNSHRLPSETSTKSKFHFLASHPSRNPFVCLGKISRASQRDREFFASSRRTLDESRKRGRGRDLPRINFTTIAVVIPSNDCLWRVNLRGNVRRAVFYEDPPRGTGELVGRVWNSFESNIGRHAGICAHCNAIDAVKRAIPVTLSSRDDIATHCSITHRDAERLSIPNHRATEFFPSSTYSLTY